MSIAALPVLPVSPATAGTSSGSAYYSAPAASARAVMFSRLPAHRRRLRLFRSMLFTAARHYYHRFSRQSRRSPCRRCPFRRSRRIPFQRRSFRATDFSRSLVDGAIPSTPASSASLRHIGSSATHIRRSSLLIFRRLTPFQRLLRFHRYTSRQFLLQRQ